MKGKGRGEEETVSSARLPYPFISLFCSLPSFLDELAQKRLLRRRRASATQTQEAEPNVGQPHFL